MRELKSKSSVWLKTKSPEYASFHWPDGYGAFSVTHTKLDNLIRYIANQKQHHSKQAFQHEYRIILKHYNVNYDERYVWD